MIRIPDFEITHDSAFLKHFWDKRDMFKLSAEMVEKLRCSKDPYGIYGYGRWLHTVRPFGEESVKQAFYLLLSVCEQVPDAKQVLSSMAYKGEYFNEDKGGIWEKSNEKALALNTEARLAGSELAKLQGNFDLFCGNLLPADKEGAIKEAKEAMTTSEAALLWLEQLGWYAEAENRNEDAIRIYEECIEKGLEYPLYDLAELYYQRGNIAYYESLMEEGIEKEIAPCMLWGYKYFEVWDELNDEQRKEIHDRLETNLPRGIELGSRECAYELAWYKIHGCMGFEQDREEGLKIARRGLELYGAQCGDLLLQEMTGEEEDYLMTLLKTVRYGEFKEWVEELLYERKGLIAMGYEEEIDFWSKKYEVKPSSVTRINPSVIIIRPDGVAEFVEADVYPMSYREMAALIGAESLDAVHTSNVLSAITRECGLKKNVAMYVDREAVFKNLGDNAAASILYAKGIEIRGSVIITMEDNRYDTHSFDIAEDIEAVFNCIQKMTNGLIRKTK